MGERNGSWSFCEKGIIGRGGLESIQWALRALKTKKTCICGISFLVMGELAQGQEVEFHEIQIGDPKIFWSWDQIILPVFMRSNFLSLDRMANSCLNLT